MLCLVSITAAAQTPREKLLADVERNNLQLQAERELTQARVLEARSGNTLPNPTVGYDYLWGSPRTLGKTGELNVSQGFDFPTVYGSRSRLARAQAEQYGNQYAALRQQVLLDAQTAYIELSCLRRREAILREAVANAERLSALYAKKVEAGDANILDRNKIDMEMMNAHYRLHNAQIDTEACLSRLRNLNGGQPLEMLLETAGDPLPELPALDDLMERYRDADPALGALRSASDAAGRQVSVAKGEALPKFEVGYRRETATGEHFDGIKMGMSIPLFESRHTVKRARAEQAAAQVQLRNGQAELEIELRRQHAKAALLLEAYNDRRMVMTPERNAELLHKALEAGQISVVNYFTELQSVYQVRESALDFERDYRIAVAGLLRIDL